MDTDKDGFLELWICSDREVPEKIVEPAETELPEETKEPAETELPEEKIESGEIEILEQMKEPAETKIPEETIEPGKIEIPETIKEPVETGVPEAVESAETGVMETIAPVETKMPQESGETVTVYEIAAKHREEDSAFCRLQLQKIQEQIDRRKSVKMVSFFFDFYCRFLHIFSSVIQPGFHCIL